MSDRVEALRRFHERAPQRASTGPVPDEAQAADLYRSLDADEVREMAALAIGPGHGQGHANHAEILLSLACLRPGSLADVHETLIEQGILYPGVLWHGAGAQISARILDSIPEAAGEPLRLNHRLLALAWIGDAAVCAAFARWRDDPPAWASSLHVPPQEYAEEAGWELAEDGTRRDLFRECCHPLVAPTDPSAVPGAVAVAVDHEGTCGWCGRMLTTLLELDLTTPELTGLGIVGQRLRIATCDICSCYAPVFTRLDREGGSTWYEGAPEPSFLPRESHQWPRMPSGRLAIARTPRPWIESASWLVPGVRFSQVGGIPTWIQDAEYPQCPDCGRRMPFVGQVSNDDLEPQSEGIYYAFTCTGCGVAAVGYQQS